MDTQHAPAGGAFTIGGFCNAYHVSRSTTYNEAAAGRLIIRKCGRRSMILLADAERWAKSLPKAPAKSAAHHPGSEADIVAADAADHQAQEADGRFVTRPPGREERL